MKLEDVAVIGVGMSRGTAADAFLLSKAGVAYLVNAESTILVRYDGVTDSTSEQRWKCADWERGTVEMDGDQVVFRSESGGCSRSKRCSAPAITFGEVDEAWKTLSARVGPDVPKVTLTDALFKESKGRSAALDEGLSHVELWYVDGRVILKQRDLYSGSLIEVDVQSAGGIGFFAEELKPFDRTAMRTRDLLALFLLEASLDFQLGDHVMAVRGSGFQAIVGNCVYDDMYSVKELSDGRKES